MAFFSDHIIELLIAAVLALAGIIGTHELNEVNTLLCKVATSTAELQYESIELDLISMGSLDDLTVTSPPLEEASTALKRFNDTLKLCDEGESLRQQYGVLQDGLNAYVNKDFDHAIDSFKKLPQKRSVTHRLLASSYDRKADVDKPNAETAGAWLPVNMRQLTR